MKTQSPDTSLDAEAVLIELIRKASIGKRFNLVRSMTKQTIGANMRCWRESHPKASEQDAAIHFVSFNYGPVLAAQLQTVLEQREQQWHEELADLVTVMNPAIAAFEGIVGLEARRPITGMPGDRALASEDRQCIAIGLGDRFILREVDHLSPPALLDLPQRHHCCCPPG